MPIRRRIVSPKKPGAKPSNTERGQDIAARFFVYKLYDATRGHQLQWHPLKGMGEKVATIVRAVQLGWVTVRNEAGKPPTKSAALTDEGLRVGRQGRRQ
jgi:hypothetical protein